MRKYIVILILLILAVVSHAQVQVSASVDSAKILIGGRSHYFITVYAPKGTKISFPDYNKKKEIVPNIEVLTVQSDTIDANNGVRIRRIYTITGWDAKRYTIPEQRVIVNGSSKMTGKVEMEVQAVPIDTVKNMPMPPDDIQKVPFMWSEWIPVILVTVLALLFIGIAFYLYRMLRHKKHGWKPKKERVLSYYEQAKHDLAKIAANKMLYKEQKDYYTDVTNILRIYISQRYNINALEMTSHEILESMKDVCDASNIDKLKVIFNTVDLVKFAKYSTNATDMDYYFDSIEHFIDNTKMDEHTVVVVEPKEEKRDTRSRKMLKLSIGLLIVASIALLLYAASEAYSLLM